MSPTTTVRRHVLDAHTDLLAAVLACADGVVRSWDGTATTDRAAVVGPFEHALEREDVCDRLPTILVGAVDALGAELRAEPVAAPPYVVITSRGPVLRATLDAARLVITIHAFDVQRDPVRYVRGPADPAAALAVVLENR